MSKCRFYQESINPNLPCKHYIEAKDLNQAGFCKLKHMFRCIESLKMLIPSISQSSVKTFCQCKEKFRLSYIQGVSLYDEELPTITKLGAIWDRFIASQVSQVTFHLSDLIDRYQIGSIGVAKIKALARAFRKIGFNLTGGTPQLKIQYNGIGDHIITGVVDIAYEFSITEIKFSANPNFYEKLDSNFLQLGTYFGADNGWEYADVLITQEPKLRTGGSGKYSDEDAGSYENRLLNDILSRPAFYFIGFNKQKKTYGTRFWRKEFNLDYLRQVYINVLKDMRHTIENETWYRNELQCYVPVKCWYYPIKRSGVISDQLYYYREKLERKV